MSCHIEAMHSSRTGQRHRTTIGFAQSPAVRAESVVKFTRYSRAEFNSKSIGRCPKPGRQLAD